MGLNSIWEKAENVSTPVIWWNLLLLFLASLVPYATSLCSTNFHSAMMQGFYGVVIIAMTVVNYFLHSSLDHPNAHVPALLAATSEYRAILLPDIAIKCVGLVLSVVVWPPAMTYAVLVAAVYILTRKHAIDSRVARTAGR